MPIIINPYGEDLVPIVSTTPTPGTAAPTLSTSTLSGATHDIDMNSSTSHIEEIDGSGESASTFTISNPANLSILTVRIHSISSLDITWPANVYDETSTAFGTTSHSDDVMYTFYYNGTNFYAKST